MNRRDFLKFLGGTAAVAAVAPAAIAEAFDTQQAYPVYYPCPATFGTVVAPTVPAQSPGFVVLEPGMSVQEAIAVLPKEGGTVYIRSGTYVMNQEISIPEGVQIVGEGSVVVSGCAFTAKPRQEGDAPLVFLMEEDDNVEIIGNVFNCGGNSMFDVPIGEHLAAFKEKMQRLYLKAKQLVI